MPTEQKEENSMTDGYVLLDNWTPFRRHIAYLDTVDIRRADDLFRKYRIKVRVKDEWRSPDGRYRMVFCSVWKRQQILFEKAMSELSNKMILLGYDDYKAFWNRIVKSE